MRNSDFFLNSLVHTLFRSSLNASVSYSYCSRYVIAIAIFMNNFCPIHRKNLSTLSPDRNPRGKSNAPLRSAPEPTQVEREEICPGSQRSRYSLDAVETDLALVKVVMQNFVSVLFFRSTLSTVYLFIFNNWTEL